MRLSLLRGLDYWLGASFLYLLALPMRLAARLPASNAARPRHVFIKLKGGGSLIIAMPMLLGLRRANLDAEFILVCAREAKIYADLTGIFDRALIVDDSSLFALILSGLAALRGSFRASRCVDLEPNSLLAALFTMLTCAPQRIGLVRPEMPVRVAAYTSSFPLNPTAPIYIYYDQLCRALGAVPADAFDCRAAVAAKLPPSPLPKSALQSIGIAAFTSDFARERMMPPAAWAELLRQELKKPARLYILGAAHNKPAASELTETLSTALPAAEILDLSGGYSLAQSIALLAACDEVWAVDSGLLHIARLLGVPTFSFWGPTSPAQRLRPIPGLAEETRYRPFICSPCVQALSPPPCGGRNLCMMTMAQPENEIDLAPVWVSKK